MRLFVQSKVGLESFAEVPRNLHLAVRQRQLYRDLNSDLLVCISQVPSLGKETVLSPSKHWCTPSQGVNRCSAPVLSSSCLGDAYHALCPCFRLPPSLATVSCANFYCTFRSIWQHATNNGLPDGSLSFKALKPIATHVPISETAHCLQDLLMLGCLFVFALGLLACIVLYSSRGLGFNRMEIHGV